MSAIAHILLDQGHMVSGSDLQQNALTKALAERGAHIYQGHSPEQIGDAEALVVTSAVRAEHVELSAARARGIAVLKRADLWATWSRMRPTIAVAGTHGKTTTTAMIAYALTHAGMNPGFLIGGESPDLGTNARWGDPSAPLVIEADEYDRTFLALVPHVAVITNCEWDHVDIYASAEAYQAAFQQFTASVAEPHNLIVCADDPGALQAAQNPAATHYGIDEMIARDPASCRIAPLDWAAAYVRTDVNGTQFDLWRYDRKRLATRTLGTQQLIIPGAHNVRNALAALAACTAVGAPLALIREALARYHGTLRRFELKGEVAGITVIDDYAHHPTEVRATLAAARERYTNRRIITYLQPHTYSRTKALIADWPDAFMAADMILIGDIYAAREQETLGMSAEVFAAALGERAKAVGDLNQATHAILRTVQTGDVVLTLGAGDSQLIGSMVLAALGQRAE